ncbi:MAG: efflux RND transporter periplasmic adaptor subunit [Myxococcales bacterium]|nr:efflux RND transporter periplasmic adaptor subunit [Myxococcales bacterium]
MRMLGRCGSACLVGGLLLTAVQGCGSPETPPQPTHPVVVAQVSKEDVPIYAHWVGSVAGFNNAQIRSQVSGYLLEISYEQGTRVEQGALLFEIDPREFRAALDASQGQLREAQAVLTRSRMHVERYKPLAEEGAISQQEYQDAVQSMARNKAALDTAQAKVDRARLDLNWTRIESPIVGVAGIAEAQIGDLVGPKSVLTTVSQLDPVKVRFPISEQEYLTFVKQLGRPADGKFTGAGAILQLQLADDSAWPHPGTPFVLGREVDPLTGTILVEGRFPNPGNTLRPGLFARVRAHIGDHKGALLVPQRAVKDVQGNYQLAVVNADDQVEMRNVEMGETVGERWIVKKGITMGERVVVEGLQKIRNGMRVAPRSAAKAPSDGKAANETSSAKS